jgi:MoxR-like ATPase
VKFGGEKLADDTKSSQLFLDRFRKLFEHLRTPYDLSDRSFGQYYRLARARALLAGREHLEPEDCKVLYYCGKNPHATSELRAWVDRFLSSG